MSFYRPKTAGNSYRSPKALNQSASNKVKPQKSVAFQENSELGNSISTTYERVNYGNSPNMYDHPNRSCGSLLSSPKKGAQSVRDTPKDLVKSVIRQTSGGYVDEDYPESVDKLLEDGFEIVSGHKNEKNFLLAQRDALEAQIALAGKDLFPELRRGKYLKETLKDAHGMRLKHFDDIYHIEKEIGRVRGLIEKRNEENRGKEAELQAVIHKFHNEIQEVSSDIEDRRNAEKHSIEKLEKKLVVTREQQKGLNGEISDLKAQLGQMKQHSLARTRMIENKTNTFVGMLHHKGY